MDFTPRNATATRSIIALLALLAGPFDTQNARAQEARSVESLRDRPLTATSPLATGYVVTAVWSGYTIIVTFTNYDQPETADWAMDTRITTAAIVDIHAVDQDGQTIDGTNGCYHTDVPFHRGGCLVVPGGAAGESMTMYVTLSNPAIGTQVEVYASINDNTGIHDVAIETFVFQGGGDPTFIPITKHEDLDANGSLDSGDDPMEGVTVCVDRNDDGACDLSDWSAITNAFGQASIEVPAGQTGTFPVIEDVDPALGGSSFPPGGLHEIDVASPPDEPLLFLNYLFGTITGQFFHSRFGLDSAHMTCEKGFWVSRFDVKSCEPCPQDSLCDLPPPSVAQLETCSAASCTPFRTGTVDGETYQTVIENVVPGTYQFTPGLGIPATWDGASFDVQSDGFVTHWLGYSYPAGGEVRVCYSSTGEHDTCDSGTSPIVGITVELKKNDVLVKSGNTGTNGSFFLGEFDAGLGYTVWADTPPGLTPRLALPFVRDYESGETEIIHIVFVDEILITPKIVVTKWVDEDEDGAWDDFEVGMPGVTINLLSAAGALLGSDTTGPVDVNEDGSFDRWEWAVVVFPVEPNTTYQLTEDVPAGMEQSWPPGGSYQVSVGPAGPPLATYDFGNVPIGLDWGDALEDIDDEHPEFPYGYPVRAATDGARHWVLPQKRIGSFVDADPDGQPHFLALGDDLDVGAQSDDEDGVVFTDDFPRLRIDADEDPATPDIIIPGLLPGRSGRIVLLPASTGQLDAWFDWNRNGAWETVPASPDNEQVFDNVGLSVPRDTMELQIPDAALPGFTYARFRFSSQGNLETTGFAFDGEVEDHLVLTLHTVTIDASIDTGDANPGDGVCDDGSGQCSIRAAIQEANASGTVTIIRLDGAGKRQAAAIVPQSPLPPIEVPLIIEGGGSELVGTASGVGATGLTISTDAVVVRDLTIRDFDGNGITIDGSTSTVMNSRIQNNGGHGVHVLSGTGNSVLGTTFAGNGGLGIAVDGAAPEPPTLTAVTAENGHVTGTLSGAADAEYRIELFAGPACDASGAGEGDRLVGSSGVATDGSGSASIDVALSGIVAIGDVVTATSTAPDGSTSAFSSCVAAISTAMEPDSREGLPDEFVLEQNFPNPFNPNTRIAYVVPEAALIRLVVYDLLGRPVRVLVDGRVPPGVHSADFDATGLPSGIYVYRLHTPRGQLARSLVLLK